MHYSPFDHNLTFNFSELINSKSEQFFLLLGKIIILDQIVIVRIQQLLQMVRIRGNFAFRWISSAQAMMGEVAYSEMTV